VIELAADLVIVADHEEFRGELDADLMIEVGAEFSTPTSSSNSTSTCSLRLATRTERCDDGDMSRGVKYWLGLFGVVALAALLTTLMISRIRSVDVLEARGDLGQWTTIRDPEHSFVIVRRSRYSLPPNVISGADSFEEVKHRRLRVNMKAGEILTEGHLLRKDITSIFRPPGSWSTRHERDRLRRY
jgi:hypothetical protein